MRRWIDPNHASLSVAQQCELLNLPRSTWYYAPAGETQVNLAVMRAIDEQYLRTPVYGSRKMVLELDRPVELLPDVWFQAHPEAARKPAA